jgi:hypothetical protein
MPGRRVSGLTRQQAEALAETEGNVVMQPTWDVVFEPWQPDRLRAAIARLAESAARSATKEACQEEARGDPELRELAAHYQVFYERVSDPAVAASSHMQVVWHMLDTHARMQRGELSETSARAAVSERALASVMGHAAAAPPRPP